ncbi:MAG: endopeptidase La [Clostridia bacterium]
MNELLSKQFILPTLPLRGIVPFPDTTMNIDVGREKSLKAVDEAENYEKLIFLLPQQQIDISEPTSVDLEPVGVVAEIKSIIKISNDNIKLLVTNQYRAKVNELYEENGMFFVKCEKIEETINSEIQAEASLRILKKQFNEYIKYDTRINQDIIVNFNAEQEPIKFINLLASTVLANFNDKKMMLSTISNDERLAMLMLDVEREIEIMQIEKEISSRVRKSVDKSQKEYYLREQMKAISEELGDGVDECNEYREKINALKIKDKDSLEKIEKEINRLEKLASNSPDSGVIRSYLDWIIDLPWNKTTKENTNIAKAKRILDDDHYGLEKVKERILEFISVHTLTKSMKGSILCLVGPPGVGKTSIAKSIARAVNRNFIRMSLGGIRDEAEIRGHRKTYVGAMPGRIIYNLRNSKSVNPLFLLDEIDKMSSDFRGDPASAMLEVLDPEINGTFRDNYLEIPYDLSKVFFVTTANSLDTIPEPLIDRMEIIEVTGYTEEEKIQIAKKYLVPKKAIENGLEKENITFTDKCLSDIINYYTRESGVRNLEREISNVYRKIALKSHLDKSYIENGLVLDTHIEDILGVRNFSRDEADEQNEIGACTGLAWTSVGGTTLTIEVSLMSGKGEIILTGKLGDVMKESARAALSYIHSHAKTYNIDEELFESKDIHIHVPEGATPKDGPSAGITMATAILSAFINKPVDHTIAMTGEITLRGKVLAIGGLKEKALAAHRIGINRIIIPKANEKDLIDIPQEIKAKMQFYPVESADEVVRMAIVGI